MLLSPFVESAVTWLVQSATSFQGNNNAASSHCHDVCARFAERFGPLLRFPNDDDYTFWDSKQQETLPACRVQPLYTEDVSYIVQNLVDKGCRFAVKAGGHSREKDDSNSAGGVTIDLQHMRSVRVSDDRTQVRLGAGHTLYSAYTALEKDGLTFIGGRAGSVGIAGFTLGGGYSNLSPRYGLAMDNVFGYEIVLANGSIVNANETHNADLYFALRGGGGNNFGVVTHFTARAIAQNLSWGGNRTYKDSQTPEIVSNLYDLTTYQGNDTEFAFWGTYSYSPSTDSFGWAVNQAYHPPTRYPEPFEGLNKLEHESSTLRLDSPSNFSVEVPGATGWPVRNIFATITHYPSVEMELALLDIFKEEARQLRKIAGFEPRIVTQPLHKMSMAAMKLRGGNPVKVEAEGPLTVVLLIATWQRERDDTTVCSFGRQWLARAQETAERMAVSHPYLYINYALREQDPYSGFARGSVNRLRDIQKRVDPKGIFTSTGLCPSYFKLR